MEHYSESDLIELERQLSCPEGKIGIEVGLKMNDSNYQMIENSIYSLNLTDGNNILEIGFGNCSHLDTILSQANALKYYGLEISETMCKEAQNNNFSKDAVFSLYNGVDIPYQDLHFHRILSVNSIYFWSSPIKLIQEFDRCLKPGGLCVLAFVDEESMHELPFVRERFTIYNEESIKELIKESTFVLDTIIKESENAKSKDDALMNRKYNIAVLKK